MILVVCFLHTREQMCLHQTPGRRPSRITGRVVNTVTRPWVGAPNERTSCRVHDAVVGFVDRRHRGLGISPLRIINIKSAEFFSGRSWPNICPGVFFFLFFLENLEPFYSIFRSVLIASGTEILWRVSSKFKLFWQHLVSIGTGLTPLPKPTPLQLQVVRPKNVVAVPKRLLNLTIIAL